MKYLVVIFVSLVMSCSFFAENPPDSKDIASKKIYGFSLNNTFSEVIQRLDAIGFKYRVQKNDYGLTNIVPTEDVILQNLKQHGNGDFPYQFKFYKNRLLFMQIGRTDSGEIEPLLAMKTSEPDISHTEIATRYDFFINNYRCVIIKYVKGNIATYSFYEENLNKEYWKLLVKAKSKK